ncbi:TPA: hypothetical protein ACOEXB_000474 [Yersinia enterocolitica]
MTNTIHTNFHSKTATQPLDRSTDASQHHADSSGIAQKNHTIGFGLLYKFYPSPCHHQLQHQSR